MIHGRSWERAVQSVPDGPSVHSVSGLGVNASSNPSDAIARVACISWSSESGGSGGGGEEGGASRRDEIDSESNAHRLA